MTFNSPYCLRRQFTNVYRSKSAPSFKVDMNMAPGFVGSATFRGDRLTNEDRISFGYLNSIKHFSEYCKSPKANPFYFCVVDGHGGVGAADYVASNLGPNIEKASRLHLPELKKRWHESPVYINQFEPACFRPQNTCQINPDQQVIYPMRERLSMAFMKTDLDHIESRSADDTSGAVCTTAIIHGKDDLPFWESLHYRIEIAHLGDTRCILGERQSNKPLRVTTSHHPDNFEEIMRLRECKNMVTTDSFGEFRFGSVANTRAFGESLYLKREGIISEPDIFSIDASKTDYTFMALVSDGVWYMMDDQELLDITHASDSPAEAATNIVNYCMNLSCNDNATCIIVRLGGWDHRSKYDTTQKLRMYKLNSVADHRKQ